VRCGREGLRRLLRILKPAVRPMRVEGQDKSPDEARDVRFDAPIEEWRSLDAG